MKEGLVNFIYLTQKLILKTTLSIKKISLSTSYLLCDKYLVNSMS